MFKLRMPSGTQTLPDRKNPTPVPKQHFVNGNTLVGPFPETMEQIILGMGCFWGAEKMFWQTSGVFSTSVGYSGGTTRNPTYEDVCSGRTGHTEVVKVVWDPKEVDYSEILRIFWEGHDPTQGMRQGNDIGTQYRSAIYYFDDAQLQLALTSQNIFQEKLTRAGYGEITTEIQAATDYFFAEHYHQQYLAKVPNGYCGLGGTGISCEIEPLAKMSND